MIYYLFLEIRKHILNSPFVIDSLAMVL